MRLFLLDLGRGRTRAIAIANLTDNESSSFEQHLGEAMPIVESFQFVPATP
jgi:hypothetical protein